MLCNTVLTSITFIILWFAYPFPHDKLTLFTASPVVTDAQGEDMLWLVSSQDQWCRSIPLEQMSPWLIKATVATEDNRFYEHDGVDVVAVMRAIGQNITERRIVSGASTLTMQVCRMMEDRARTLASKAIESFRAVQLDCKYSKDHILEIYLNYAPYGGNIRGVEAASRRYFGKSARDLSLAEAAFLAGLPQSPSRYHPRKHFQRALKRQRAVLTYMFEHGVISEIQYKQAMHVSVVLIPPQSEPHLSHSAWMALQRRPQGGGTWIDLSLQQSLEQEVDKHLKRLPPGSECAVVVIDIARSTLVGLVGSGDFDDPKDGQVNGALALRSPGSTLKPFVYATAFEAGRLASESTVYDVPINLGGWQPNNFDRTFRGELTAGEALRLSLNSPALQIAHGVGFARCRGLIEACGLFNRHTRHRDSGLAWVVGGEEVSLLSLTNAYACLGREGLFSEVRLFQDELLKTKPVLDAAVCTNINHILSSVCRRPRGLENWPTKDIPWFMWKTGTSSGRRDAWAVGHNHRYAIGVWVGTFRGTGRAAYVGGMAAEPLLARLFTLSVFISKAEPEPIPQLIVRHPLPKPKALSTELQITYPVNGDSFVAVQGEAIIRPTTNSTESLTWFLNGRLLAKDMNKEALHLTPGQYQLHCINQAGAASSVHFVIK